VVKNFKPFSLSQQKIGFDIYHTNKRDVKFCDETGVNLVGNWEIELPESDEFIEDTIKFTLTFDTIKIYATAENQRTGDKYHVEFKRV